MPQRHEPDDPREWINRSRSSLTHARSLAPGVYLEELCFDAQQAAEKAVKAVFIHRGLPFPYTHNLQRLLTVLSKEGVNIPDEVWQARELSAFAFESRYPGVAREVKEEQYRRALDTADAVLRWAEEIVFGKGSG